MNYFEGKVGPALIAEIGGNHEGNFEYAKELTRLAISTNVDFIKFQLYTGNTLVSKIEGATRNKHFKKFELSKEQHIELAKMVSNAGIHYMASVWDEDMIDWIDEFIPVYKVGSGDLTAYSVLEKIIEKKKPIIISTGLSTEEEVLDAVAFIQGKNELYKQKEYLAVLQCTSMYPISAADSNLAVMDRFRELTNLTIGYSDHTEGPTALLYSVAMGAEVLEFHFTDSREGKVFRDHKVSLTPAEVIDLQKEIQLINTLKGDATKRPLKIETDNDHVASFRRAVYPKMDIKKGTIITKDNITVLRPNTGIDARDFYKLLGMKTTIDLKEHQKLSWELFEK